jgi:cobalt-zinc-cadmium efflux system membrane fusion protein
VGRAKASFLQSLAQVRTWTLTVERMRETWGKGAVSERSLREAEASLREARIKLFNDQQALLNLGLPLHLKEVEPLSEEQQVRHLRLLGLPESVRKMLDAETATANLLPLTAPFDGVVVERNTAPGEIVEALLGKYLFVVADVGQLHIDLRVNPRDMTDVRLGQTVTFHLEGKDTPSATAEVSHISPEVDAKTRRVYVHAEVTSSVGQLRPNTFGTGRILIRQRSHALVVPSEAVQADSNPSPLAALGATGMGMMASPLGQGPLLAASALLPGSTHPSLVFIRLSPTTFQVRQVRTGLRDGSVIEIDGVQPGEEVVTTGSFALKSELRKEQISGGDE